MVLHGEANLQRDNPLKHNTNPSVQCSAFIGKEDLGVMIVLNEA